MITLEGLCAFAPLREITIEQDSIKSISQNKMKKILKWFLILFVLLIAILAIIGFILHESKPEATPSPEADNVAQKMMAAVNKAAWDTTAIISWDFAGRQQYLWDKDRHFVKVMWGENTVLLHTKSVTGKAFTNGVEVIGDAANGLVQQAWKHFCNDSFWLNAVVKAFDPGTTRSIVQTEDNEQAMMVNYSSGGVTPGDSYAWILDENGLPTSYKMWVGMIPIGGVAFTWENWKTLSTGAKVATLHKSAVFDLEIQDVKGAASLEAYGLAEDPFSDL